MFTILKLLRNYGWVETRLCVQSLGDVVDQVLFVLQTAGHADKSCRDPGV